MNDVDQSTAREYKTLNVPYPCGYSCRPGGGGGSRVATVCAKCSEHAHRRLRTAMMASIMLCRSLDSFINIRISDWPMRYENHYIIKKW